MATPTAKFEIDEKLWSTNVVAARRPVAGPPDPGWPESPFTEWARAARRKGHLDVLILATSIRSRIPAWRDRNATLDTRGEHGSRYGRPRREEQPAIRARK